MDTKLVPAGTFALAVLLAWSAGPASRAIGVRAPRQATPTCTAKATAKSAKCTFAKFDAIVTDVTVQVTATAASQLKVTATLDFQGQADLTYPPPGIGRGLGLRWMVEMAPANQTKSYPGPVNKLETAFKPWGATAGNIRAGAQKALERWRKSNPEFFKPPPKIGIIVFANPDLIIGGTYNCKDGTNGTFEELSGRVPYDSNTGNGVTTLP